MNIIGNWKGYYEYGVGYSLPYFGKRVKIEVVFDGTTESFKGYINEEESEYSVPLKASIKGFSEEAFISFVKKYPGSPRIEEGSGRLMIDEGELEIEHEGVIDFENDSIYGAWFITEIITDEEGSFEMINQGIWFLERSN